MTQEKKKSIGGLYQKTSKNGLNFLKGFVEVNGQRVDLVAFHNADKLNDKAPDYSIYISEPLTGANPNQQVVRRPVVNKPVASVPSLDEDYGDFPQ